MTRKAAFLTVLLVLIASPLVYLHLTATPLTVETTVGEASIYFRADRSRIVFPGECMVVSWKVENIVAVFVNGEGKIGSGELQTCSIGPQPELAVDLRGGRRETYTLPVERTYQSLTGLFLLAIFVICLGAAAYALGGSYGLATVGAMVVFGPMLRIQVNSGGDYIAHTTLAASGMEDFYTLPPHFLYHALIIGLHRLFPAVALEEASFRVILAAYVFTGVLVLITLKWMMGLNRAEMTARTTVVLSGLTLGLMLVGPISVHRAYFDFEPRSTFIFPNTYHNPTGAFLKPFALGFFLFLVSVLREPARQSWRRILALAVLTILTALAKPNYLMALVPAVALVLAYGALRSRFIGVKVVVSSVIVPAALVLGGQYLFLYGAARPSVVYAERANQVVFAPLRLYALWGLPWNWLLPDAIMSMLFPLATYMAYFHQARRDFALNLAWLTFLIAAAQGYLFLVVPGETAGDMLWGGQITLFILFVVSTGFLLRQNHNLVFGRGRITRSFAICSAIFAAHLVNWLVVLL